ETLEERNNGQATKIVGRQLEAGLKDIPFTPDLVIAYEPVWAIGTGVNATAADAQEMSFFIRNQLDRQYNRNQADIIRILYGGSVKPENIEELMQQPDIDGALVGGASLDPMVFARIVNRGNS
ncbi:MAG: triose-phosphate isomerase family protein, partial [Chitinophagales bacterium]